ncbi:MAG: helix-turn-helix domain-containing protein [Oscillospiraceae bacterium]|nr:helix-turn-helix domain-containing protein [Oscillospiraceae bacterium]MCL2279804.1 helix-turn-helix domain-containing protein [Oscillospiraceae bacterium]
MLSIGEIIRSSRIDQSISQETLCFGICSASNLSRIENGEQVPTRITYEALLERLGQAPEVYPSFLDDRELEAFRLKHQINQSLRTEDFDKAEMLVNKLNSMGKLERVYEQLILHVQALLMKNKGIDSKDILDAMKKVAAMSIKNFSPGGILRYLLSKDDLTILNNLAISYYEAGEHDTAIEILYAVKEYIERKVVDDEGISPLYAAILHPLTNWVGMKGLHKEVVALCDIGIKRCVEYGAYRSFAALLFNKGYALVMLEEHDEAKKYLQEAYYVSRATGDTKSCKIFMSFAVKQGLVL